MNILTKLKHNFTITKLDWVDALVLLFLLGFGVLVVDLAHKPPGIIHTITILVILYFMIRTVYERVINRTNIPTLETGLVLTSKMIAVLKKDIEAKKGAPYRIIDLGSGDGQLTRAIARACPTVHVIGIENGAIPFAQAQFFKQLFGFKNLDYQKTDFFEADCSAVAAVVMYLSVQVAPRLGEKLYAELKTGALVISNEFELKGQWPQPEAIEAYTPFKKTLFVYRKQ